VLNKRVAVDCIKIVFLYRIENSFHKAYPLQNFPFSFFLWNLFSMWNIFQGKTILAETSFDRRRWSYPEKYEGHCHVCVGMRAKILSSTAKKIKAEFMSLPRKKQKDREVINKERNIVHAIKSKLLRYYKLQVFFFLMTKSFFFQCKK
jgi:hypothetical protein